MVRHHREIAVASLIDALKKKNPEKGFRIDPSLEFVMTTDGSGMIARAATSIKKDDILIVVPDSSRLGLKKNQYDRTGTHDIDDALKRLERKLKTFKKSQNVPDYFANEDYLMTLVIMRSIVHSRDKMEQESLRFCHMATWPSVQDIQDMPIYWNQEQIDSICNRSYMQLVLNEKRWSLRSIFDAVVFPILSESPEKFIHHDIKNDDLASTTQEKLWKSFCYAFTIAYSRQHEGSSLIPLVDLFNGMDEGNASDAINVNLARGRWPFIRGGIFVDECNLKCSAVYALKDIKQGEELIISYGEITPFDFLTKYGTVPLHMLHSHNMKDTTALYCVPELIPTDNLRIQALEQGMGFNLEDLRCGKVPVVVLGPDALASYQNGGELPDDFKCFRQYIIISSLADDSVVQRFVRLNRLTFQNIPNIKFCKVLCQTIDYNINLLSESITSDEDMTQVKKTDTPPWKAAMLLGRISQRETLLVWRHLFCETYGLLHPFIQSLSPCQSRSKGYCSVCGRTYPIKMCMRCKAVWYCSREHQKMDWKRHKTECKAK